METIDSIYRRHCETPTAITPHLPRLRALADGLMQAVEFGVKRGASSSALLLGAERVLSYDIAATPQARELAEVAGERWDYRIGDSRQAQFEAAELLFIDSQHDYETMRDELDAHADRITRYIVAHDVGTFGEIGANGDTGTHKWQYVRGMSVPLDCLGIRPALDELMVRDPSWRIVARYCDSHGLLVLKRR